MSVADHPVFRNMPNVQAHFRATEADLTPAQRVAQDILNGNLAAARSSLYDPTQNPTILVLDTVYALSDLLDVSEPVEAALAKVRTLVSTLHR